MNNKRFIFLYREKKERKIEKYLFWQQYKKSRVIEQKKRNIHQFCNAKDPIQHSIRQSV